MIDTNGVKHHVAPYHTKHWAKKHELEHLWDSESAPPDKWIATV